MAINIFVTTTFDTEASSITKVHTYVSYFLDTDKFRVYMFVKKRRIKVPPHIIPITLPKIRISLSPLKSVGNCLTTIGAILKIPARILHIIAEPYLVPLVIACKKYAWEKKVILTFHGVPWDSRPHFVAGRILSKQADIVTSVSKYTAQLVRSTYGVESQVIYNGVDTEFFHPSKNYNEKPRVLFIGRLVSWKRPHWIAKSAKEFPQVNFIIHGRPPRHGSSLAPLLFKLARRLPNLVISTKFLTREEFRSLYQTSDIFCFPSTDWMPLVVLEAMACGLPVLLHAVGGQAEVITNGKEGFTFRTYDEMKKYLQYLLEDENIRREMGKRARIRSLDFSWKLVAKKYEKLYEEVVSEAVS